MTNKIFIVAGNHAEYNEWVRENIDRFYDKNTSISLSDFVYVRDIDTLRGHREVHGYYIGSHKNRPDIKQIQEAIFIINHKT